MIVTYHEVENSNWVLLCGQQRNVMKLIFKLGIASWMVVKYEVANKTRLANHEL